MEPRGLMLRGIRDRVYGDLLMPSGLEAYGTLLESILARGYRILCVGERWAMLRDGTPEPPERLLVLRHDIDTDPRTGAEMWQIERTLGITGSWFFRRSTLDLELMGRIAAAGGEVSYHYEELATVIKARGLRTRAEVVAAIPEAQDRFAAELERLRQATGQPMTVVASHGDFANRRTGMPNWALLLDRRVRERTGIELEVYDERFVRTFTSRHTDTGHPRHWVPADLETALEAGSAAVHVLVHPRNWYARRADNIRDDVGRIQEGMRFGRRPPARGGSPLADAVGGVAAGSRIAARSGVAAGTDGGPSAWAVPPTLAAPQIESPDTRPGTLLVRTPDTFGPERRYILDVVLGDWLGVDHRLEPAATDCVSITLAGDAGGRTLRLPDRLFSTPASDWLSDATVVSAPLPRLALDDRWRMSETSLSAAIPTGSVEEPIPILFADPHADGRLIAETPSGLAIGADLLGAIFYQLARYEEVARPVLDEHDRYPGYASLGAIDGWLEQPVVDRWLEVLVAAIGHLWPTLAIRRPEPTLHLTHDIDRPWSALGEPTGRVVHSVAADLLRRRDVDLAWRRTRSLLLARMDRVRRDPYDTFDALMAASERHGLRSTFYVMAGSTEPAIDAAYRLSDPRIRRLLRRIHDRGHAIGLHASYHTYRAPETMAAEADALRAACVAAGFRPDSMGVRQHYLRFEAGTTWRAQAAAGLEHDSSLGFADQPGFRAGTSREFNVFDLTERRVLPIRERPLVAMDVTLFGYLSLGPDAAAARVERLVGTARDHGGDPVVLYHNDTLSRRVMADHYERLVDDLTRPR